MFRERVRLYSGFNKYIALIFLLRLYCQLFSRQYKNYRKYYAFLATLYWFEKFKPQIDDKKSDC